MKAATCPKCQLPLRTFVTCACGASRLQVQGMPSPKELQDQQRLARVVAAVRSGATTITAVQRVVGLTEHHAHKLVAQGIALGLLTREPGRHGWLHACGP